MGLVVESFVLSFVEKYQVESKVQFLQYVNEKMSSALHLYDDLKHLRYAILSKLGAFVSLFVWYEQLLQLEEMKYQPEGLYCAGKECSLAGKDMYEGFCHYRSFQESQEDIKRLNRQLSTLHRFLSSVLTVSNCQRLIDEYAEIYRDVNGVINNNAYLFFRMGYDSVGKGQNETGLFPF